MVLTVQHPGGVCGHLPYLLHVGSGRGPVVGRVTGTQVSGPAVVTRYRRAVGEDVGVADSGGRRPARPDLHSEDMDVTEEVVPSSLVSPEVSSFYCMGSSN